MADTGLLSPSPSLCVTILLRTITLRSRITSRIEIIQCTSTIANCSFLWYYLDPSTIPLAAPRSCADDGEVLRRLPGVGEGDVGALEQGRGQHAELVHHLDLLAVDGLDAGQAVAAHVDVVLRALAQVLEGHPVLRLPLHDLPRLLLRDLDVRQVTGATYLLRAARESMAGD